MVPTYVRPPPMFEKGEGCYMWDVENRKYLDFTAGIAVNALGHCDAGVVEVIAQQVRTPAVSLRVRPLTSFQAKQLMHTSNLYHNPHTGLLSKQLIQLTHATGGFASATKTFICYSGSEANEAASKFSRKVGKSLQPDGSKYEFVSLHNSFHGRTMGSLSATPNPKYQTPFSPMVPGFKYGTYNDIEGINSLVTESTCGVIIEPIQGEGGVNVATPEFMVALRKRCTEVGAVLIHDEIQCGLGRTGTFWAHAMLPKEAHPDVVTTAKALGNGFPIGATIVNDFVCDHIKTGDHGTTFGGNPLGSRVASYILSRLSSPEILESIPAKEAAAKALTVNRTLSFNASLNAVVASVFMILVGLIVLLSIWEWLQLLLRHRPPTLHESTPVWLPEYALAESRGRPILGFLALGVTLAKELSGEAHVEPGRGVPEHRDVVGGVSRRGVHAALWAQVLCVDQAAAHRGRCGRGARGAAV